MSEFINYWLLTIGGDYLNIPATSFVYPSMRVLLLVVAVVVVHWVVAHLVTPALRKIASKIRIAMFAYFIKHKVFLNVLRMIPVGLLSYFSPFIQQPVLEDLTNKVTSLLFIVNGVLLAFSLLSALYDHFEHKGVTRRIPIKAFFQFIKIACLCIAIIFAASIMMNKSPTILLSSLGAISAVLLITFRDPIYQLSCGIAVTSQKLCNVGDWVALPKLGVDGELISMGMTTCQVQQWDNSIISVNMNELMSGMVNWQNIFGKGRRIKRNFLLDLDTVKFLHAEDIQRLSQIPLLKAYMTNKLKEDNPPCGDFKQEDSLYGRRLTNIGTFRAYVEAYLANHPAIDHHSTLLVRLLESTDRGIPLQIYCFTNPKDSAWVRHEGVSSDISDWLIAAVKTFDLKLYQQPSQFLLNNDALSD